MRYKLNPDLCEGRDIDIDEDDVRDIVRKELKTRDFEKIVKRIVSKAFVDYNEMMFKNRHFLKNQL